jgi:phage baseplate assembly protein W
LAVLAPHFDLPFRFGKVCEQGTQRDIANCVFAVVVCPKGQREERPGFGSQDLTFDFPPVMTEAVKSSIASQEPRAQLMFDEQAGRNQFERLVKVYVQGGS